VKDKFANHRRVLAALPATRPELMERLSLSQTGVHRIMKQLHTGHAAGKAYICGWRRTAAQTNFIAVYAAGKGKDVPSPDSAELLRAARKRYKRRAKSTNAYEESLARARARYWRDKPAPTDLLMEALYGQPEMDRATEDAAADAA
jgi:hypothetical protein